MLYIVDELKNSEFLPYNCIFSLDFCFRMITESCTSESHVRYQDTLNIGSRWRLMISAMLEWSSLSLEEDRVAEMPLERSNLYLAEKTASPTMARKFLVCCCLASTLVNYPVLITNILE